MYFKGVKSLFCSSKQMYPANANAEVSKNCFRPGKEMGISYMLTLLLCHVGILKVVLESCLLKNVSP